MASNDWFSTLNIPPDTKDPLLDEYQRRLQQVAPGPQVRKKVFGVQPLMTPPVDVRGTASPMDIQQAENIQKFVHNRPEGFANAPMNLVRGAVGMVAGLPQMVGDPLSMAEGIEDIGLRMEGTDPEKLKALQDKYGIRLQKYIENKGQGEWLTPEEEAEVKSLIGGDAMAATRVKTATQYPLEVGLMAYGGAKGLAGRPGRGVASRTALDKEHLAVAAKTPEGKIIKGQSPKDMHYDLARRGDTAGNEMGFTTPDGQYLDRKAGLQWVKQNQPDIYRALRNKDFLESSDYQYASGLRQDTSAVNDWASFIRNDPFLRSETGLSEEAAVAGGTKALGKQQTVSRTAKILEEPRYTEKQPVSEWIKTLKAKQFPKDEPALLKVLADLEKQPLKERLTKGEVQQMLNKNAPELETVMTRNPTHPEREGELFVRDPNEYTPPTEEVLNRRTDLTIEKSKARDQYNSAVRELEKMYSEFYRSNPTGPFDLTPNHPEYPRLQELIKKRDMASEQLNRVREEESALPVAGRRYDGHSWAKQDKLSEPLGRTGFYTKNNPDGSKTLVIDNFQMPTEGSGSRSAMPPAHEARAYDLMAQSILNYAREKGYRDVEWTTGAEQNRRWGVETPEFDPEVWRTRPEKIHKYDIEKGGFTVTRESLVNGPISVTPMNGGFELAFEDRFVSKYPTLEEAKDAGIKMIKSRSIEGDLRPLYDKTLPKLMEKHGQGEKIGENTSPMLKWENDLIFKDDPKSNRWKSKDWIITEQESLGGIRPEGRAYFALWSKDGSLVGSFDTLKEAQNHAATATRSPIEYHRLSLDNIKSDDQLRTIYDQETQPWSGTDTETEVLRAVYGEDLKDLGGEFPDFKNTDPDEAVEIINAIRKNRAEKERSEPRQYIRVEGHQLQPLVYAKAPLSQVQFYAAKGDKNAQEELKRRKNARKNN